MPRVNDTGKLSVCFVLYQPANAVFAQALVEEELQESQKKGNKVLVLQCYRYQALLEPSAEVSWFQFSTRPL